MLFVEVQLYTEDLQKSTPPESLDTGGLLTSGKLYVQIV